MTKSSLRNIIGGNIRHERMARDISLEELAAILGLTSGFVGLIERGQRGATPFTLYKLGTSFGLPIDAFFKQNAGTDSKLDEKISADEKQRKIEALIYDFSGDELDYIISILKSVRAIARNKNCENK